MHLKAFHVTNFRRLRDVRVDLDAETTIFVGANNSGKTSATQVFRAFFARPRGTEFQIYDFSAACWATFDGVDVENCDPDAELPRITLDLWFEVEDADLQRVVDLIPDLDWTGSTLGVRLEYGPRDGRELIEAYAAARAELAPLPNDLDGENWKPWPQSLTDYLSKRLKQEYVIRYFVLDRSRFDDELHAEDGYEQFPLEIANDGAANYVDSLVRVDFLDAQRKLADQDVRGRDEELSKRLGRFYQRNLEQHKQDVTALNAIAGAEARLNEHFAQVFEDTLGQLAKLGYPGLADPQLVVKAELDAGSILNANARVF